MKWSLKQYAQILSLPIANLGNEIIQNVAFDSRQVTSGSLFFALSGEKVDGHQFLEFAAQKGAIAAIVSNQYIGESYGLTLLPVSDPLLALALLAKAKLEEINPIVIGITGSVGKTTTKEFAKTILQSKYRVAAPAGNSNTKISLPTFILNCNEPCEIMILEMGATHAGDIDYLLNIAPLDYSILTNISKSHVSSFGGVRQVAREKSKILSGPKLKGGIVCESVLNFFDVCDLGLTTYAIESPATTVSLLPGSKGEFQLREKQNFSHPFTLPISASQHLENFTAVVALALKLNMSFNEIIDAAQNLKPFAHRFQTFEKGGSTYIDDSYNASVTSFLSAFESLPKPKGGKRIGVFGAMRELGEFSKEAHAIVAKEALEIFDEVHCIGDECRAIVDLFSLNGKSAKLYKQKEELEKQMKISKGDLVLIKGSNSFKLWEILEKL
ncbi:MAG: UDP-N-acetylmuramoyl-tripeptide--D-alanyl-D-alanine ligase [Rhabdochlamydiaceae bacterium]|nr:UDP-N-acetylmuramoyl-tripeptide--D-alanyl-D-alanine ligase [Candidatus Amphrikana amoebophyrae]